MFLKIQVAYSREVLLAQCKYLCDKNLLLYKAFKRIQEFFTCTFCACSWSSMSLEFSERTL